MKITYPAARSYFLFTSIIALLIFTAQGQVIADESGQGGSGASPGVASGPRVGKTMAGGTASGASAGNTAAAGTAFGTSAGNNTASGGTASRTSAGNNTAAGGTASGTSAGNNTAAGGPTSGTSADNTAAGGTTSGLIPGKTVDGGTASNPSAGNRAPSGAASGASVDSREATEGASESHPASDGAGGPAGKTGKAVAEEDNAANSVSEGAVGSTAGTGAASTAVTGANGTLPAVKRSAEESTAGSEVTGGTSEIKRPALRRRRDPLGLAPGQKFQITGYAEQQQTTIVDDKSSSKPASYHRAQMRVTGSMCMACLNEFQEKLKQVFGVERARVARSEQVSIQSFAPDLSNWADAILFYDASKVDFLDLRAYMRGSGYYPYKVLDKEVNSLPPEEQKKI